MMGYLLAFLLGMFVALCIVRAIEAVLKDERYL